MPILREATTSEWNLLSERSESLFYLLEKYLSAWFVCSTMEVDLGQVSLKESKMEFLCTWFPEENCKKVKEAEKGRGRLQSKMCFQESSFSQTPPGSQSTREFIPTLENGVRLWYTANTLSGEKGASSQPGDLVTSVHVPGKPSRSHANLETHLQKSQNVISVAVTLWRRDATWVAGNITCASIRK